MKAFRQPAELLGLPSTFCNTLITLALSDESIRRHTAPISPTRPLTAVEEPCPRRNPVKTHFSGGAFFVPSCQRDPNTLQALGMLMVLPAWRVTARPRQTVLPSVPSGPVRFEEPDGRQSDLRANSWENDLCQAESDMNEPKPFPNLQRFAER